MKTYSQRNYLMGDNDLKTVIFILKINIKTHPLWLRISLKSWEMLKLERRRVKVSFLGFMRGSLVLTRFIRSLMNELKEEKCWMQKKVEEWSKVGPQLPRGGDSTAGRWDLLWLHCHVLKGHRQGVKIESQAPSGGTTHRRAVDSLVEFKENAQAAALRGGLGIVPTARQC